MLFRSPLLSPSTCRQRSRCRPKHQPPSTCRQRSIYRPKHLPPITCRRHSQYPVSGVVRRLGAARWLTIITGPYKAHTWCVFVLSRRAIRADSEPSFTGVLARRANRASADAVETVVPADRARGAGARCRKRVLPLFARGAVCCFHPACTLTAQLSRGRFRSENTKRASSYLK